MDVAVPVKHKIPGQVVKPTSTPAPSSAVDQANPCHVAISADGSGAATIFISPETLRRYKLRAQGVPLDQYLYANVLRAALESHVY